MVKRMFAISGVSLALLFVFWGMFLGTKKPVYFTLGIVAMTVCYHFTIRLVIGNLFDYKLRNCVDYKRKWFAPRDFEEKLYKKLRVKKWKKYIPTADESLFSFENRTPKQILMSGCQAEIVHETCAGVDFWRCFWRFRSENFGYFSQRQYLRRCAILFLSRYSGITARGC